jgi:N-acetylmuramoyl-L-alanine amidase
VQHPCSFGRLSTSSLVFALGCALLGSSALSGAAQEAAGTPTEHLVPVHLWVAGRTLPLRVSPLTDTHETYVPLTALPATGAAFRLVSDGNAVHITARSKREEDVPLIRLNGAAMIPLSTLARVLDASVETSASETEGGPAFRSSDTVYLLAHVTDARFENGWLHVKTSFPVPSHTRMLAETKPLRGYVDCVGAQVSDSFQPAPLRSGEREVLKLRTGQTSPTVARVVVELADGVALHTGDAAAGTLDVYASAYLRPGAKLQDLAANRQAAAAPGGAVASAQSGGNAAGEPDSGSRADGASAGDPGGQQAEDGSAGPPAGAAIGAAPSAPKVGGHPLPPPIEVRGLDIAADDPAQLRFNVVTGSRVRPIVRYSPGTTQMLVDIPNSVLTLPDDERDRAMSHPLISGARLETIQGAGKPTTRLTLDTSRILGYSVNIQEGSFVLELRVPRNATGVLADKVIVVDAGHGGSATGAKGGGICEKDCTLAIALKLRAELEACGARVVMTRTRDADVSLTDRSRMGNEIGADFFVSVHNDSNERSNSASGTSTYYHNSEPSSRALATCIQHAVMATTGLPSRGVLSDTVMYHSGFAVLRGSSMPAVLCEVAYINNQTDRRKLIDPQFQQRVAKAICDGLRNYVEGSPHRTVPAFARPMPGIAPMPSDSGDAASDARGS